MKFFKIVLATIVGIISAVVILVLLTIGIVSLMLPSGDEDFIVGEHSVLHVKLDHIITDRTADNPFANMSFPDFDMETHLGLNDILKNIEKARDDENIDGIFLDLSILPTAGLSTVEEIRNALLDFKQAQPDKFIISYANAYTQKSYYLASTADSVFLHPEGELLFKGMNISYMFFTHAFEKLGITPHVLQKGKFKSAVEPFMLDSMSQPNRVQTERFLFSMWNHILGDLAQQRGITTDKLNEIADSLYIRSAEDAQNYQLVDGLRYRDEIISSLKQLTEKEEEGELELITMKDYKNAPEIIDTDKKVLPKERIAVIYATGEIRTGEGDGQTVGSETLAKAIRDARKDDRIKAIVLRVNSPGGSALASDIIWRETVLAQQVKPLIVSMGDVAASGGYYISAAADTIVASPTTITGSIGVFGLLFSGQQLLTEKIGVTVDGVKTNTHADIGAFTRPMSEEEKAILMEGIDDVYTTFKTVVAEGRGMTVDQVDSIGQGRVWTGTDALELGLVDVLGGMDKAIEIAAEKAGLENYRLIDYPETKDPFEEFMEGLMASAKARILQDELGETHIYYHHLKQVLEMEGIQARLPYYIEIY